MFGTDEQFIARADDDKNVENHERLKRDKHHNYVVVDIMLQYI
jgi:hypothetical protein